MYVIVWQYRVRPGNEAEFVRVYGPSGDWAQLFGKAEGYLGTRLSRDTEDGQRFVTLDMWESEAAFAGFRDRYPAEYKRLDEQCEGLTESEQRIAASVLGKV